MTASAIRAFNDVVDRIDAPRQQPREVEAALRARLAAMSAGEIEDFQHGFDLALASVRTSELWAAATLVHEASDPHDYDGFAAWLLLQGDHVVRRAHDDPDAVIAALTRRLFAPRRRPRWDNVLELAQRTYESRFDRDLYDIVAAPAWSLAPLQDGEPKAAVHWTHPSILMQRYPQLWRAFDTRALRVMPMSDECEPCACCGRVHVDAYGLLGWKKAALGAYTLHFVEGAFGHVDSTITLDDGERSVMFGVRHSQRGSRSGLRVLECDEMPWQPADERRVLGRDAAHAHPRYRLAMKAAMQAWERDPRLAVQRRAWRQRRLLAGASARRVARASADAHHACASCGKVHGELEISHRFPDALATMSRWQWRHRVRDIDRDELVLDDRRRFVRGLLPTPVVGRAAPYRFGVWAERLDPADGTRAIDGAADAARRLERGPRALLANDLLCLPDATLGLEVSVRPCGNDERPDFTLDADVEHPLAALQRGGMPADLPRRLLSLVPHD
jgi:hypothetical protein